MSHLLLLTKSTQSSVEVLPALALLPHHVKILPAEASALISSTAMISPMKKLPSGSVQLSGSPPP